MQRQALPCLIVPMAAVEETSLAHFPMPTTNLKRDATRWAVLMAGGWLLLSLACNLPAYRRDAPAARGPDLQGTLIAMDGALNDERSGPPPTDIPTSTATRMTPAPQTPTPAAGQAALYPKLVRLPGTGEFAYLSLPGDTLPAVAARFNVAPGQIRGPEPLPPSGYLPPGLLLTLPDHLGNLPYPEPILPDSEVIYSPSALDFDLERTIQAAGGYLAGYQETLAGERLTGAQIIQRVATERSTNPRILLAFLEFRSGWIFGQPRAPEQYDYPIGFFAPGYQGLYRELTLAANHLNIPYYAWRTGSLAWMYFKGGGAARLSPGLNAGSAAVQTLFSEFYERDEFAAALYGPQGFLMLYREMFGDPWGRAGAVEPLLHPGVRQPTLELPFPAGETWSFTGGPHKTLELGSPLGALDFSPVTGQTPCAVSTAWVTASAPGVVTRSEDGIVVLDLDGDGNEQTGWVLFYLHIAAFQRVPAGAVVEADEPLGHPSCEGGEATGAHVHLARKYQGEWIAADGPDPFVLSGWQVRMGARSYQGTLVRGGQLVWASPGGARSSLIER